MVCARLGFSISFVSFYSFICMNMVANIFLSRVLSQRLKKSLQGFTLVELIVVITILAILSAI